MIYKAKTGSIKEDNSMTDFGNCERRGFSLVHGCFT